MLVLAVALVATTVTGRARWGDASAAGDARLIRQLSFEFVGQFQNSPAGVTPATHVHYGYLSYVGGAAAFKGSPENETTALFTFYADAATTRVIADGPLRIITRVGTLTIYRDASVNGSFDRPETFRDGERVLVHDVSPRADHVDAALCDARGKAAARSRWTDVQGCARRARKHAGASVRLPGRVRHQRVRCAGAMVRLPAKD
jgi:hypothetical protein